MPIEPHSDRPPRVFISYARTDGEAFARALRKKLETRRFSDNL